MGGGERGGMVFFFLMCVKILLNFGPYASFSVASIRNEKRCWCYLNNGVESENKYS